MLVWGFVLGGSLPWMNQEALTHSIGCSPMGVGLGE
jgi:hypothetical protein